MAAREGIKFKINVTSDVQPLNKMIKAALYRRGCRCKGPNKGRSGLSP